MASTEEPTKIGAWWAVGWGDAGYQRHIEGGAGERHAMRDRVWDDFALHLSAHAEAFIAEHGDGAIPPGADATDFSEDLDRLIASVELAIRAEYIPLVELMCADCRRVIPPEMVGEGVLSAACPYCKHAALAPRTTVRIAELERQLAAYVPLVEAAKAALWQLENNGDLGHVVAEGLLVAALHDLEVKANDD